ncbi:hypothetical protein HZS_1449 [Henneguya salminicola]|nr:hypothetical protein HZS_1449 [Henneguya salminicola]
MNFHFSKLFVVLYLANYLQPLINVGCLQESMVVEKPLPAENTVDDHSNVDPAIQTNLHPEEENDSTIDGSRLSSINNPSNYATPEDLPTKNRVGLQYIVLVQIRCSNGYFDGANCVEYDDENSWASFQQLISPFYNYRNFIFFFSLFLALLLMISYANWFFSNNSENQDYSQLHCKQSNEKEDIYV